jgi:large subunit ribosomal protein L22
MAITAKLNDYRMSPRKARLVADTIRGRKVAEALAILTLSRKSFAKPLEKLLRSAVANAEDKNQRDKAGIDVDNLFVSKIHVDPGPSMWRIRARAQGRAGWIQKRSSHVTIELVER